MRQEETLGAGQGDLCVLLVGLRCLYHSCPMLGLFKKLQWSSCILKRELTISVWYHRSGIFHSFKIYIYIFGHLLFAFRLYLITSHVRNVETVLLTEMFWCLLVPSAAAELGVTAVAPAEFEACRAGLLLVPAQLGRQKLPCCLQSAWAGDLREARPHSHLRSWLCAFLSSFRREWMLTCHMGSLEHSEGATLDFFVLSWEESLCPWLDCTGLSGLLHAVDEAFLPLLWNYFFLKH